MGKLVRGPGSSRAQSTLSFAPSAGGRFSSAASSSRAAGGRQATLESLTGVVEYGSGNSDALDVPSTLYLGKEEVEKLKAMLAKATPAGPDQPGDVPLQMQVLKRLSTMPCTRRLLEQTGIGVVVGRLRKSPDAEVASICERLVKVWKGQLQEHRAQKNEYRGSSSSSSASGRNTKPAPLPRWGARR